MKPGLGWATTKDAAAGAGIAIRNFTEWNLDPVGKIGASNYYLISDVVAYREKQSFDKGKQAGRIEVEAEMRDDPDKDNRERLVSAQADAQEMKNSVVRLETVQVGFLSFLLSKVSNETRGVMDSMPLECMRLLNLTVPETEKIRGITATLSGTLRNIKDVEWVERAIYEYLVESGQDPGRRT